MAKITLFISDSHVSVTQASTKQAIQFQRSNGELLTVVDEQSITGQKKEVEALLGRIRLLSGFYLVVVTKATVLSQLNGADLIRADKIEMIPLQTKSQLNQSEKQDEDMYLALLDEAFEKGGQFYYVNDWQKYDLTRSAQKIYKQHTPLPKMSIDQLDPHFFWNHFLVDGLIQQKEFRPFFTPVIRGFIEASDVKVNGKFIRFIIISRLSCKRVGTRFNTRGLDTRGHAANFAETEQIAIVGDQLYSFMQIRASVPVFWSQKANLKYNPPIIMKKHRDSKVGYQQHMKEQTTRYGKVVCVSLINQKGVELPLHVEFEKQNKLLNNSEIKYVPFDFHKECKKMKYENIELKLINQIQGDMDFHGYFSYNTSTGEISKAQKGVVRTNCKDCLDRTNVVESEIGRIVLQQILRELSFLPKDQPLSSLQELNQQFKYHWADNGDAMSQLYAGTSALKRDFTRTGKRTLLGLWDDFKSSVTRYYLNNFTDGTKQDGISLLLGKYRVKRTQASPFQSQKTASSLYKLLALATIGGLTLSGYNVLGLFTDLANFRSYLFSMSLWIAFALSAFFVLLVNSEDIVTKPYLKSNAMKQQSLFAEEEDVKAGQQQVRVKKFS